MRLRAIAVVGLVSLSACGGAGTPPPASPASILPLRTLRLYETGVGYFERAGVVAPTRDTTLPLPAGHIDDALMSLVVLSRGGKASVQGLEFGSSVSQGMARAMAGLPKGADTPINYRDLLLSLKGAEVTVTTTAGRCRGRLVDVLGSAADGGPTATEAAAADEGSGKGAAAKGAAAKGAAAPPAPTLTLLVLTERAEIRRFRAPEVLAVQPTDPARATRLRTALDALTTRGGQTRRLLKVLAQSRAPVTLGYIAETPIWRTTYRLVLDPKGTGGRLQGWALVHNDTDEDWRDVRVELVNGRPDSFLFPLAAPRYARRRLIPPATVLSTVPQLQGTTVDKLWGDHVDDEDAVGGLVGGSVGEAYGAGGLGLHGVGMGGGGMARGGDEASGLLAVGNLAALATNTGVEAGALFSYALAQPLSLRAHGSALVPFVAGSLDAQAITWVARPGQAARAAVRVVNSTGQTLPDGPIALYADGGFAGESALDRLKPGERRFLQFGADLDLEVSETRSRVEEEPQRVTFAKGVLAVHYLKRRAVTYALENRGGRERTVYLALAVVKNATVTGADAVDYDAATAQPVAVFRVPARRRVERPVRLEEGLVRRTSLGRLSAAALRQLAAHATLGAKVGATLVAAATRQEELERTRGEIAKQRAAQRDLRGDLDRLRGHLKAAGGDQGGRARPGTGGAGPLVQRILAGEDRLIALRRSVASLEEDVKRRQETVRVTLARLGE